MAEEGRSLTNKATMSALHEGLGDEDEEMILVSLCVSCQSLCSYGYLGCHG